VKQPFIFAILAATLVGAAPAQAQLVAADMLPPYEVSTIVASMGMRPIDRPIWRNGRYVVNAIDRNGREVRVVLDAQDGQVIAVRPRMRDYVYEPRYAAPPPPEYPRGAYEPRYDQRYGAPPLPPAAIPGGPPPDDDDEYFDDDRQQGSLMPPSAPRGASSAPREVTTGSVPRRTTSIGPTDRKAAPAKPADGKTAVNRDEAGKNAAPVPRPRPAVASTKPDEPKAEKPKTTGGTEAAGQLTVPDMKAGDDKKAGTPDAKDAAKEAANAKSVKPEAEKAQEPKSDVRVIDMSKPKTEEKLEEKPGEAIRY
jgi:hypothetical protein